MALLALYGTAVTEHDPGAPLVRGLVLFLLVAAWLWLPRMSAREAAPAAIAVLAVGVLALPLAARLDAETAVIDYQSWNWFGGKDVTFDWNHSYGPLDWSREGTTLLNVRSDKPLYWKAETLDSFDGLRWVRSVVERAHRPRRRAARSAGSRAGTRQFRVTVRSLRTDFVIGAGTPYLVHGRRRGRERLGRRHHPPARRAAGARRQLPRARLRARPARARCARTRARPTTSTCSSTRRSRSRSRARPR